MHTQANQNNEFIHHFLLSLWCSAILGRAGLHQVTGGCGPWGSQEQGMAKLGSVGQLMDHSACGLGQLLLFTGL